MDDYMKILDGLVAEPGEVEAKAYFVEDPSDYLESGGVMVSQNPGPELTPQLLESGAIVTEEGGMLSHAAVVARENEIPALVGVEDAMDEIQDGEQLYIQGTDETGSIYRPDE